MEEQTQKVDNQESKEVKGIKGSFFAYLLLIIGVLWLIQVVFNVDIWLNIPWEYIWPIVIILLAIKMIYKKKD